MASSPLKGLARRVTRPLTRPVDGRVADINRRVSDTHLSVGVLSEKVEELSRELAAYTTTTTESNSYVGVEMRRLEESIETLLARIDEHERRLLARIDAVEDVGYIARLNRAAEAELDGVDGAVANLVNRANGHRGFAAQAGLWFNSAVTVELSEGSARLATVNERIVELPFALGALARLSPPARILDIGSAESTFSLSVASLGYQVTAVDLHPMPYSHPNLQSVVGRLEDWDPGPERFDAAFLISAIEHFGIGAYGEEVGQEGADRAAVARVGELLSDDGFLVLTTPYGPAGVDALERTYDDAGLAALLEGWTVLERRTELRRDERTWMPGDSSARTAGADSEGVVMVVAAPARQT
jgi:hypothetical protein